MQASAIEDSRVRAAEGRGWYALYTRHQHEKVLARSLTDKGFEVFLPLYTATHEWKDRLKQVSMPLFPCYVFLHGGLERRLDIVTTPSFHSFVSTAGLPATIPATEIEQVRQAVERTARIEPHPFLKAGDRVRVKWGPLEGLEGILVRKKNLYRLVLCVELLQRSAAVELDVTMVERIACPGPIHTSRPARAGLPAHV